MKVLVTGGAGRLGYCVSKQLVEKGHSVRVFDLPQVEWSHVEALGADVFRGDITDLGSVAGACYNVDAVVHLAALLPPRSETSRELTMKVNVHGTEKILKSISRDTPIVLTSSISTYGVTAQAQPPLKETSPQTAHNNYSESKINSEKLVRVTGNPTSILRIAPISVADLVELPDVIPYREDQRVEFVFVDDAATAMPVTIRPGWMRPVLLTTTSSERSIHIPPSPLGLMIPCLSMHLTTWASCPVASMTSFASSAMGSRAPIPRGRYPMGDQLMTTPPSLSSSRSTASSNFVMLRMCAPAAQAEAIS